MTVRNALDMPAKSFSFNHVNYYVDMPAEMKTEGVEEDRLQLLQEVRLKLFQEDAFNYTGSVSLVQIVQHSLGGGTAALLTYVLREQKELSTATCVTFAAAACMTWELAESGNGFITSVINGKV
ncbi:hypothetical protein F0562_025788 [Nyssa sinensis]|uniref:Fungal lipase-type domain-containing protein n=1 Tax=Nyssa sinensis TaxID=561372 RepID=A0A5J5B9P1_9ASTE|nr:hypothetical protein F0562_025788 [Nyssa sinensis]